MELWMAAVLFLFFAGGVVLLFRLNPRNWKKGLLIAGACVLGGAALACIFYIVMTFLVLNAVNTK